MVVVAVVVGVELVELVELVDGEVVEEDVAEVDGPLPETALVEVVVW